MNQDLAQLTILPPVIKLSLSMCGYQPLQYLSSSSELRNLAYFELRNDDKFDNSVNEDAKALITRNQNLRHFCLHMRELQNVSIDPQKSPRDPPYLWRLHFKLRTLSLLDLTCQDADVHTMFPG